MSANGNIELLSATLAKAKSEDRAALVAYLPAGFPTVDGAVEAVKAIVAGGADAPVASRPWTTRWACWSATRLASHSPTAAV
ncbi:hypothetical protein AB0D15_39360, partial [Streptomyces sp. NPDC048551]